MSSESVILLDNAVMAFGGRCVLNGLTADIRKGEIFVIIGPSGTGKSVTLKLISGLLEPTAGRVTVLGEDVNALSDAALSAHRRRIGYLFQSGALLGWKTLAENVALPLLEHGRIPPGEIDRRVAAVLEEVGLGASGELYPAEVSGGMIKRAGFARAIVEDPELLLFDEPTSGLDPVMSRVIDRLIASISRARGVTCVVVTHDLAGALQYADRIAFLKEGRFLETASPEALLKTRTPDIRAFLDTQFVGGTYGR